MADSDSQASITLDLDNSSFVDGIKEALDSLNSLGDSEGPGNLLDTFVEIGTVVGVAAAAVGVFKESLELTEEYEKAQQIEATFNSMAENAGINAEKMKTALMENSNGFLTETQAMNAANNAMIYLGDNADKMAEIMSVAVKETAMRGGDLQQNFESLSRALATGNTHLLKRLGINVDATKAEEEFAAASGHTADELTAAGKQQAVFNAALDQAKEKFGSVNTEMTPVTNSVHQLAAAWGTLKEAVASMVAYFASGILKTAIQDLTGVFGFLANKINASFGTESQKNAAKMADLTAQLFTAKQLLNEEERKYQAGAASQADVDRAAAKVGELSKQLKAQQALNAEKQKEGDIDKDNAATEAKYFDNSKKLAAQKQFQDQTYQLYKQNLDQELAAATSMSQAETIIQQKKINEGKEFGLQLAAADQEAKEAGIQRTAAYQQRIEQMEKQHEQKMRQLDADLEAQRMKTLQNYAAANDKNAKGITAEWAVLSQQQHNDLTSMQKLGQTSFKALGNNATTAFQAIGNGSETASQAMRGFFLGAIGDMAEQYGEMLLLEGIWPPNPIALAAGGALIALGSALKSQAGAGATGSSSSSGGGAGAAAPTSGGAPAGSPTAGVGRRA